MKLKTLEFKETHFEMKLKNLKVIRSKLKKIMNWIFWRNKKNLEILTMIIRKKFSKSENLNQNYNHLKSKK